MKSVSLMVSESELVRRCKEGNPRYQELLYHQYAPMLMGICLRYARNTEDAEDILHDSFVKIFVNMDKFNEELPLINWIRRIAINTAINAYYEKKKTYNTVEISEVEDSLNDVRITNADFLSEKLLLQLISELPDGYRTVFNLYEIDGYPQSEIAEMLGCSNSTVRTQLFKAKKVLKEKIELMKEESLMTYKK
jgi:RNA polymerase sigma-70 factor (ECF subfamily)